jgi:hypothetical protein
VSFRLVSGQDQRRLLGPEINWLIASGAAFKCKRCNLFLMTVNGPGECQAFRMVIRLMKKYDRISSLVCVGLAIAICFESIRVNPGNLSNPGPGFLPLVCGSVLGILGIIVFIRSCLPSARKVNVVIWDLDTKWREMISTIISLIAYASLMNFIGFYIMTFLWIIFTCKWIARLGWRTTILISALIILFTYVIISHYLGIRFPVGTVWEA